MNFAETRFPDYQIAANVKRLKPASTNTEQHTTSNDTQTLRRPLTVHLEGVRLKELLIAVGVTGVVTHVGGCHLGDVQRAVIAKVLARGSGEKIRGRVYNGERDREILNNTADSSGGAKVKNVSMVVQ